MTPQQINQLAEQIAKNWDVYYTREGEPQNNVIAAMVEMHQASSKEQPKVSADWKEDFSNYCMAKSGMPVEDIFLLQDWIEENVVKPLQSTQQPLPAGLRWVKASERLPESGKVLHLRVEDKPLPLTGYYSGSQERFRIANLIGEWFEPRWVEWLSETTEPEDVKPVLSTQHNRSGEQGALKWVKEVLSTVKDDIEYGYDIEMIKGKIEQGSYLAPYESPAQPTGE